jgi:hypothetical protein
MGKARCYTAKKVKYKVTYRAEAIFHIVAKYVKRPHISQKVPESPMEKHEREYGKKLLASCKIGCYLGKRVTGRDKAINIDETL